MNTNRFDGLTRTLAATGSRRRALAALAGGLFAILGGRGGEAADKVPLCHRTGSAATPFILIEVSGDALAEHTAHGDFRYIGEPCREPICGGACASGCCLPSGECDNDCGFD
jgi:hypothetical protein